MIRVTFTRDLDAGSLGRGAVFLGEIQIKRLDSEATPIADYEVIFSDLYQPAVPLMRLRLEKYDWKTGSIYELLQAVLEKAFKSQTTKERKL